MKKVTVRNSDGTMEEYDVLNTFKIADLNKNFIILSKGEMIKDDMCKIYVSEIIDNNSNYTLVGITDDSVWEKVKLAMRDIAQGGAIHE